MSQPDDSVLPCGCVIRAAVINDVNTVTFIPCRQSCRNYGHFIEQAAIHDLPVEYREAP